MPKDFIIYIPLVQSALAISWEFFRSNWWKRLRHILTHRTHSIRKKPGSEDSTKRDRLRHHEASTQDEDYAGKELEG